MDREYNSFRSVTSRTEVDDGWAPIREQIEVQDIKVVPSQEDYNELVKKQHQNHRGEWLTMEIAKKYCRMGAMIIAAAGSEYKGKLRELGNALEQKFGVTELEARNILCGVHIGDYVEKYQRMQRCIPLQVNEQFWKTNDDVEEYPLFDVWWKQA